MKFLAAVILLTVVLASTNSRNTDAPAGFDNQSNGMVDDATHQDDQAKFDDTETVADGLGPLYNAQSCRECHQNPTSGGTSQVAELRVGHQGPDHLFHNPEIPIAHGAEIITGRTWSMSARSARTPLSRTQKSRNASPIARTSAPRGYL